MVQRAEREPTMEEIVVALRDARRSAGPFQSFAVARPRRGNVAPGSVDLTDLRDTEIERLLAENAQLNARVISLLKILEQEQANAVHLPAEPPLEPDHEAIYQDVRAALEAELGPLILLFLRLLHPEVAEPPTSGANEPLTAKMPQATPSEWIVELMHKLEGNAAASSETGAADQTAERLPQLRQCVADVLGALGLETAVAARRRRTPSTEDPA